MRTPPFSRCSSTWLQEQKLIDKTQYKIPTRRWHVVKKLDLLYACCGQGVPWERPQFLLLAPVVVGGRDEWLNSFNMTSKEGTKLDSRWTAFNSLAWKEQNASKQTSRNTTTSGLYILADVLKSRNQPALLAIQGIWESKNLQPYTTQEYLNNWLLN